MKTPTVTELRALGYKVTIDHYRTHKMAYIDINGKIVVKTVYVLRRPVEDPYDPVSSSVLMELLPKGGVTEVTVTDTDMNLDFFGNSRCRENECYNKKRGVAKCLERIHNLMLVTDGKVDEATGKVFKMKF